jgi:hypothetical protein
MTTFLATPLRRLLTVVIGRQLGDRERELLGHVDTARNFLWHRSADASLATAGTDPASRRVRWRQNPAPLRRESEPEYSELGPGVIVARIRWIRTLVAAQVFATWRTARGSRNDAKNASSRIAPMLSISCPPLVERGICSKAGQSCHAHPRFSCMPDRGTRCEPSGNDAKRARPASPACCERRPPIRKTDISSLIRARSWSLLQQGREARGYRFVLGTLV